MYETINFCLVFVKKENWLAVYLTAGTKEFSVGVLTPNYINALFYENFMHYIFMNEGNKCHVFVKNVMNCEKCYECCCNKILVRNFFICIHEKF